ncbi:MAG: VCBS repeat-containing protein [Acidimicrobiales bacterium]|nr:VCBS repeat-containing protein [Acidimicrobiales bacterium]
MQRSKVAGVAALALGVAAATGLAWWATSTAGEQQVAARPATQPSAATPADVDGDGRSDLIVRRADDASFWVQASTDGPFTVAIGAPEDRPTMGDFDGDGRTDLAVIHDGAGPSTWTIQPSGDGASWTADLGQAGDVALPGDYDGDGRDDLAVFRPVPWGAPDTARAVWLIRRSSDDTVQSVEFGIGGDLPVPGDYDGDGRADLAVQRDDTRWILRSGDAATIAEQFGTAGDVPAALDRDGDGRTDLAVVRSTDPTQTWYVRRGATDVATFGFGRSTPPYQQRVIGDYDGDGTTEPAVFDADGGVWWLYTGTEPTVVSWGRAGDVVAPFGVDPTLGLGPAEDPTAEPPAEPDGG